MDIMFELFIPPIRRIIFSYLNWETELQEAKRRLKPRRIRLGRFNMIFYRNWSYAQSMIPPGRNHVWLRRRNGYYLIFRSTNW